MEVMETRSPLDSVSSDVGMDYDDQNVTNNNEAGKNKLADAALAAVWTKKAGSNLKDSFKRRKESNFKSVFFKDMP